MSSLLLGERTQPPMATRVEPPGVSPVALSASHRFSRESQCVF